MQNTSALYNQIIESPLHFFETRLLLTGMMLTRTICLLLTGVDLVLGMSFRVLEARYLLHSQ